MAGFTSSVLACLRWAENLRDRMSGFRVIQLLAGAGPATAARVLERLAEAGSPVEALANFKPPASCAEDWPAFAETLLGTDQALRAACARPRTKKSLASGSGCRRCGCRCGDALASGQSRSSGDAQVMSASPLIATT